MIGLLSCFNNVVTYLLQYVAVERKASKVQVMLTAK